MSQSVGKVYLVGGGPGDPGLLSLKARDCLRRADVVVYDGLVNPAVLAHTRAECERTSRINDGRGRRLNQEEINARLVEYGLAGKTVVRLKGGDPYIFGRGSEEAVACLEAGIPFEVVPGVTSATAAGAYAGFSLTHRDHASAVAFITGHEDPDKPASALDYAALAAFPGTLVFYMGLHRLPQIAESLIASGKAADTPAAVVSKASTPQQRSLVATLGELPEAVQNAGLRPPSLIVVGDCVTLREQINWFENLPLFGLSIGITRPQQYIPEASQQILERGGRPVAMPTITVDIPDVCPELTAAVERLDEFDAVTFTSQSAIESFFRTLHASGRDARALGQITLACVGDSTATKLRDEHRLMADVVPPDANAESLARALLEHTQPRHVLWPKSDRGRDVLPTTLRDAGVTVTEAVAYTNSDMDCWPSEVDGLIDNSSLDWVTLTSPSTAKQFARLLAGRQQPKLAAISELTADAAREAGLTIHAIAPEASFVSVLDAIATTRNE